MKPSPAARLIFARDRRRKAIARVKEYGWFPLGLMLIYLWWRFK